MRNQLQNISPLDGRYAEKVAEVSEYFSEAALMKYRVRVEIEWFVYLCNEVKLKGTKPWSDAEVLRLRDIYETFDLVDAERVKEIEGKTNHDVKAIEYLIKEKLNGSEFEDYMEFVHFGCTSEDINNLSYGLMMKDGRDKVLIPVLSGVIEKLYDMSKEYKGVAMMSRTHGQTASPTTVGKELVNFVARVERQVGIMEGVVIMGKMNGAVGNYNAHVVADPGVKWNEVSKKFIQRLGLEINEYTTQIEPHDYNAELFDSIKRANSVLLDLNRDMWGYVSMGYFKQRVKEGEVGSSTMPHKVNPIDFENSEGNLGLANALAEYMAGKLPISRWQRDLTDSTTLRNTGTVFGYSVLAYKNCIQGLGKVLVNEEVIKSDLDQAWELLAEPIQTVMRKYKIEGAYEMLKKLSRGKKMDEKVVHEFINGLELPDDEKTKLKELTPGTYTGLAEKLVDNYKPKFLK